MMALKFLSKEIRNADGVITFRFTAFDENADPVVDGLDAPNLLVWGIFIRVNDDAEKALENQENELSRQGFSPLSPIYRDEILNLAKSLHSPEIKALWADYLAKAETASALDAKGDATFAEQNAALTAARSARAAFQKAFAEKVATNG